MLSKEDQRRFDQITRQLRLTDPKFFARLESQARGRRHQLLLLLPLVLWAAVPVAIVAGGWVAATLAPAVLATVSVLLWRRTRRRL